MPRDVETTWAQVGPWTQFRSRRDGSVWVTLPSWPPDRRRVRSLATGVEMTITPGLDERVTVIIPTAEDAIALLVRELDATLIAEWWEVPAAATADHAGMARHLARAHATPGGGWPTAQYGRTYPELIAYHWKLHASALGSPGPTMNVAHTHLA